MLESIVRFTNKRIQTARQAFLQISASLQSFTRDTDVIEMHAFIGLLYLRGLAGLNNHDIAHLYHSTMGPPHFGATMGKNRLQFLYACIYLSMILTRENSDGKTIDLQQSENCLKLLIKIAPNVSFRKSTSALTRRYIPPETKSAFDNTTPANRLNTVCCSNRSMQLRIHTRTV